MFIRNKLLLVIMSAPSYALLNSVYALPSGRTGTFLILFSIIRILSNDNTRKGYHSINEVVSIGHISKPFNPPSKALINPSCKSRSF